MISQGISEVKKSKIPENFIKVNHENRLNVEAKKLKILFVSSRGKFITFIPFIESQYESLKPYVKEIDHFRIGGSGIKGYLKSYKSLKQEIREGNFDIIHAHFAYSAVLCSLITKKEKLILSFMGSDLQGIYHKNINIPTVKGLINILLSQLIAFKVDGIIVKSRRMVQWIPPFFRYKTRIIPNGVNLKKFHNIEKNFARKYLKLDNKKRYIVFLGDPKDARKNFKLLRNASLLLEEEKVDHEILAPYPVASTEIPYYLAAADVLAFPSKLEGSPNVIKEAVAMGCPIVATDVGDIKERIGSINGCYISTFKPGDFSTKLKLGLDFNNRTGAQDRLNEISERNIAKKIVAFYLEVRNKALSTK